MKLSTITLALVSGASIASAERPKKNGHVVHPNDSAKPMSAVEERGQRRLSSSSAKSGKSSTSSAKSGKSKSSKSASPCEMLGMGCEITSAPGCIGIGPNTAGNFTCNAGQPFVEGTGTFLFNGNIGPAGVGCLRFNGCGAQNATTQALSIIESPVLDALIEQCEACEEVPPIDLQCTEEFLFRFNAEDVIVDSFLCATLRPNVANPASFNCESGRFVFAGAAQTAGQCIQNTPGVEGDGTSPFDPAAVANRAEIIAACNSCLNTGLPTAAVPTTRTQSQSVQEASITGSELRLSTPMAATKTPNGGVTSSGVTCLSASMLAVAAFGMSMF